MTKWGDVLETEGIYESRVFNISSNLNSYIVEVDFQEINIHNQKMEVYYSLSHDTINWSEWERLHENSTNIFDGYGLANIYFKYKVCFQSDDNKKPYLQKISVSLKPFFKAENFGDLSLKPKLWIRKVGADGDIKILNHMTKQEMVIKNLFKNEEVYVDCYNEEIISSLQGSGIYRYDDHNDEWLQLEIGESHLKGVGDFDMDIRYQGILLQD